MPSLCTVCHEVEATHGFLCVAGMHQCVCQTCGNEPTLLKCPVCKAPRTRAIRVFDSGVPGEPTKPTPPLLTEPETMDISETTNEMVGQCVDYAIAGKAMLQRVVPASALHLFGDHEAITMGAVIGTPHHFPTRFINVEVIVKLAAFFSELPRTPRNIDLEADIAKMLLNDNIRPFDDMKHLTATYFSDMTMQVRILHSNANGTMSLTGSLILDDVHSMSAYYTYRGKQHAVGYEFVFLPR